MEKNKMIERPTIHLKVEVDGSELDTVMKKLTEHLKNANSQLGELALKSDITLEVKVTKPELDFDELRKTIHYHRQELDEAMHDILLKDAKSM